jgi:SAM-dependent methyltransferase
MELRDLKDKIRNNLHPRGLYSFLKTVGSAAAILDIGCGLNTASLISRMSMEWSYTGIDLLPEKKMEKRMFTQYLRAESETFAASIASLEKKYDVVLSVHNLEHCEDRRGTLEAMIKVVAEGGRIYLSTPSQESVTFPSRRGCLNYYDDPTHRESPVDIKTVTQILIENGFKIDFISNSFRPIGLRMIGKMTEPLSRMRGTTQIGTWEYYGFEAILWATKES